MLLLAITIKLFSQTSTKQFEPKLGMKNFGRFPQGLCTLIKPNMEHRYILKMAQSNKAQKSNF
jgi:hypothetical protein